MHALSATELYTLSLHDALPIWRREDHRGAVIKTDPALRQGADLQRSARHHAAADPALLRALQGLRRGEMGEGVAMGRPGGGEQTDVEGNGRGGAEEVAEGRWRAFVIRGRCNASNRESRD